MTKLEVTVDRVSGTSTEETIHVSRIANLGMTYREEPADDVLNRHVEAMNSAGTEVPDELPLVTPKPNHLITTENVIQVNTDDTIGELEFVLFPTEDRTYVGVGNDHKYNNLGEVHMANSTCPSVVADEVWVLEDVRDHWDSIEIRSWVRRNGEIETHQRGVMDWFMRPDSIVERVYRSISEPVTGTAIWSGTVGEDGVDPSPELKSGPFHMVEMYDPVLERRLFTSYDVKRNDWIDEIDLS